MPSEIIIPKRGEPRGIYSPEVQKIAQGLGQCETRRASHVEPGSELSPEALGSLSLIHPECIVPGERIPPEENNGVKGIMRPYIHRDYASKWFADCLPVGGPVLGPFEDRDTALQKESEWLKANNIPTCRSCADNPTHEQGEVQNGIQIEPPTQPVLTQADLNLIDVDTA